MTEQRPNEALEKLNRGIQESRRTVQQQTMKLAQEYFDDSVEDLEQQIQESRSTLEVLPDQVPGGREEPFQLLFGELMENYSRIEESIKEAQKNVASLDTEQLSRQEEVEASDAARREAQELGVDLTQIEGTGAGGRIVIDDVRNQAEKIKAASEPKATDAAKRDAEKFGIDLSDITGTGSGGAITVGDVTEYIENLKDQSPGEVGQGAQQAQEAASGAAQRAQDAAEQTTGQAQQVAGQATDQAGQVAGQVQDAVGGLTGGLTGGDQQQGQGGDGPLGGVTDQVGQVTQGVQDTAGQATDQAGQLAGQATQQAQDTAGQAGGQVTGEDGGLRVTNAARRRAEEMGIDLTQIEGTGSGGLITLKDVTGS